jgi:hypothetical protein
VAIQEIFDHRQIVSLNLSYIDGVSDEAFANYPLSEFVGNGNVDDNEESTTSTTADNVEEVEESNATNNNNVSLSVIENTLAINNPMSIVYTSPLQKLFLSKSTITDASMFRLSFLSQLVEVGLQWCSSITDQGIMALTVHCPKLQEIDLKSCQITDASLSAIATHCGHLRRLDLSWCARISDAGIARLAEGLTERYLQSYPSSHIQEGGGGGGGATEFSMTEKDASLLDSEKVSIAMVALDSLSSSSEPPSSRAVYSRVADTAALSSTRVGLKSLSLVWCEQLTDVSVAALMTVPTLLAVDASGCAGLTQSALLELQAIGVAVKS